MSRRVLLVLALVALVGGIAAYRLTRLAPPPHAAPATAAAPTRLPPRPPSSLGPIGTASPEAKPSVAIGHVEGHVRDALTGAPVAGVDVVFAGSGAESTATSAADGHFALDLAPGRYTVRASADGIYGLAPAPLALAAGTRVGSYDLIVARLALVRGKVVDATGQAAPGATVSFRARAPHGLLGSADLDAAGLPGTATSADGGAFELHVVPGEVTLTALRDGRRGRLVLPSVGAGQTLAGAELVLDPGGGVAGVVHDPHGAPVTGAQVVAEAIAGEHGVPARTSATTDANGRFSIHDLPPGPARLEAHARGFAPSETTSAESRADGGAEVVLTLRAALALEGRVVDPDGHPLAGARVLARSRRSILDAPVANSDDDGRFAFTELDAGPYDLDASAEGYGTVFRRGVAVPTAGLELRLPAVGGLAGVVVDEHHQPVVDFKVRWTSLLLAQDGPGKQGENRFLAADGAFRLEGLSPGEYDVLVAAPGRAPAERRVTVLPGAYADASVTLGAGASLVGRVTSRRDGAPIAGAEVSLSTGHDGDAIQTDADGRFALADVAPGRRSLVVAHPAYVSRTESGVVVAPGERRIVDVALEPLAPGDASGQAELVGIGAGLGVVKDGAVLTVIVPGGPAERAGLVRGDVIVAVDNQPTVGRTLGDIIEDIRGVAGTSVRLAVVSAGRERVVDVVRGTVRFGG